MAKHKSITRLKKYYKDIMGTNRYAEEFNNFKAKWEETHQPMVQLYPELRETKDCGIQTDPQEPVPPRCQTCETRDRGSQGPEANTFVSPLSPFPSWNNTPEAMMMNSAYYWMWMSQQGGFQPLSLSLYPSHSL